MIDWKPQVRTEPGLIATTTYIGNGWYHINVESRSLVESRNRMRFERRYARQRTRKARRVREGR